MKRASRSRCVVAVLWLIAGLFVASTSGCQMMRNKQQRERFEKSQQEFSCGEPMPSAKR
jgi:hypothetical protein